MTGVWRRGAACQISDHQTTGHQPLRMKILVANLGSPASSIGCSTWPTSGSLRGGVERIGARDSRCFVEIGGARQELTAHVPDHAVAVPSAWSS